jgi:hypothetical protein
MKVCIVRFRVLKAMHRKVDNPDDGDSKYLWNVSKLLPD